MNAPLPLMNTDNPFSKWFEPLPALAGSSLMDHLFNRLDGAYPHKWRSNFPNSQAIDNWSTSWAEAFEEEGIKPADIRAGLKACRSKYDWPPSCAEFIKACRPSVDTTVAYYEALAGVQARAAGEMGQWSHPAIYWAAMPLAYDFGAQAYSQIKNRWERALAEQMDRGEWPAIPQPMIALPQPGKGQLSRENAAKMIEEYKAEGVAKAAVDHFDHKLWAKRIIERAKSPKNGITLLQLKFAREAMGVSA